MNDKTASDFEKAAQETPGGALLVELWDLLRHNKKWWLLPVLVVTLLLGLLVFLSGTAAAPFIYTLF